jgi:transposase-like protein
MEGLLTNVGSFCPNAACPDYGKLQGKDQHNIIKFGLTQNGTQRFRCKTCGRTFTATYGTLFYRRRTPVEEILETLAFLAEGVRPSALARVKGHKVDTILAWVREAAAHAEVIEDILMANYHLTQAQMDALWSYVFHKGEKKPSRKR